jgi:hypothetical protein
LHGVFSDCIFLTGFSKTVYFNSTFTNCIYCTGCPKTAFFAEGVFKLHVGAYTLAGAQVNRLRIINVCLYHDICTVQYKDIKYTESGGHLPSTTMRMLMIYIIDPIECNLYVILYIHAIYTCCSSLIIIIDDCTCCTYLKKSK